MMAVDWVIARIYDEGMRKTAEAELKPITIPLVNSCPKCGGNLKASILIGLGVCRPQKQACVSYCGFEKNLVKVAHA